MEEAGCEVVFSLTNCAGCSINAKVLYQRGEITTLNVAVFLGFEMALLGLVADRFLH